MLIAGLFVTGASCVLFGFLVYINDKSVFITFSFAIRIVEALGNAGYMTASFSIATQEFSDCLATMISILEMFYGSGIAIGPSVGGALYEVGGFVLPFVVLGSTLLIAGIVTVILLPQTDTPDLKSNFSVRHLIAKPEILLSMFAVVAASTNIGFLDVTLEPHLRQFGISPLYVGLMFFLTGIAYALSTPVWGRLADKGFHHRYMVITGGFLIIVAFLMIGPAPFIPIDASIPLIAVSLVIQGLGFGAEMISSFTGAQKDAVLLGFPNDLSTFGLVSGCWTSFFAFGAFFGPTCAGSLLDAFGFRNASMFIVGFNGLLCLCHFLFILCRRNTKNPPLAGQIYASSEIPDIGTQMACSAKKRPSYGSIEEQGNHDA